MRHVVMMLSMVGLALAGTAHGEVQKGDVEIEVMGGWAMESGETASGGPTEFLEGTDPDVDGWFVMGGLGRFISNHLQLAVAGFYTQLESDTQTITIGEGEDAIAVDGEFEVDAWGIGGRAKYHFNPADQWVWYAGGQVFWVSADVDTSGSDPLGLGLPTSASDSANGVLWGPVVGLRAEMGEQNELLLEYQYHIWGGDIGDVIENGHSVFVGLSHRLK